MIFNSWQFIFVFLPVTLLGFYWLAGFRMVWAQLWLILASLFFYAHWKIEYLPLLLGSLTFNFGLGWAINSPWAKVLRSKLLVLGLAFNLAALGYFKYFNFLLQTIGLVWGGQSGHFDIALPLAISFFTFTQIAYLIDVYRDSSLCYSFFDYTFFVVFFPHLIAGPIVRHNEIIPQLRNWGQRLNFSALAVGSSLFILGLAKKCLLADSLAPHVQNVYDPAAKGLGISQADAWCGTLAFALQIYFDFSAYSDMALGLAVMFGLRFPVNFASPYKAGSIIDFWSTWHMTLTRFLREYVYFSLGGNRRGPWHQALNVMVTMLLSGLWHGAGWAFIIWGGLHGAYLVVAHAWRNWSQRMGLSSSRGLHWLGGLVTFASVVLAWVWFRAGHVQTAWALTRSMLGWSSPVTSAPLTGHILRWSLPLLWLGVWILPNTQQLLGRYHPALEKSATSGIWTLTLTPVTALILGFLFCLVTRELLVNQSTLFIYFKF